jgi:hypothetical protein
MSRHLLTNLLAEETELLLQALESSRWPQPPDLCGPFSRVSTLVQLQSALLATDTQSPSPQAQRRLLAQVLDQLQIHNATEFLALRLDENQRRFIPVRFNWNLLAMVVAATESGSGLLLPDLEIEARRRKALEQQSALAQVARNWQNKFRKTKLNSRRLKQPTQRDAQVEELTTKLIHTLNEIHRVAANRAAFSDLLNGRRPRL